MHISKPSASKVATANSKIPTGGMGLVKGMGEISSSVSQAIQTPFKRQTCGLSANLSNRGRAIFSSTRVTLLRFCKSCRINQGGKLNWAIFLGSQGDRFPRAICTAKSKQADPNGPVNPGGMGNKKGKTNNVITKLKPRSEVSAIISPRLRGWLANRSSNNFISWENLKCLDFIKRKQESRENYQMCALPDII